MKVLVDADACPVKQIIQKECASRQILAVFIANSAHALPPSAPFLSCIVVGKGADAADFALLNRAEAGDVCITADYGLAAMLLAKRTVVLHPNGFFYTQENIDRLLFERHLSKEMRRQKRGHTHIPKRTAAQDDAFCRCFLKAIRGI